MGTQTARAFWVRTPGVGEIREEPLPPRGDDDVEVRTIYSGVSRGTETLVFRGEVPSDQYARMRAPFQAGEFPAPVKYGYLSVGVIEAGPDVGATVFALHPHQTRYVLPRSAVVEIPPEVDPKRAVLAGTVETAVNALWDTPPLVGEAHLAQLLRPAEGVGALVLGLQAEADGDGGLDVLQGGDPARGRHGDGAHRGSPG